MFDIRRAVYELRNLNLHINIIRQPRSSLDLFFT